MSYMKMPTSSARTIVQDNESAKAFVKRVLGEEIHEPFVGLAVFQGGHVIGAIVFNNYHPGLSVDMTAVGRNVFGIREARALARYAFVTLDCRRVTAITCERNFEAIKALKSVGFVHEGTLKDRYNFSNGLLFGLLRRKQRLIKL
jgi:RimJ/RimL family protein N-acetyltransferase